MNEKNTPQTTSTPGGATTPHNKGSRLRNITITPAEGGGAGVGPLGVAIAGVFLVALVVLLLYGITNAWPVCDLQEENRNANVAEGPNANANRSASPTTNDNAAATPGANTNVATNTNANAANRNAGAGARTNTNGGTNVPPSLTGPSPKSLPNETTTKLDADSIEPASGPINGKTLVTIKGKNFGSTKADVVVKFGEREAKVNEVSDKSISVSTAPHSEGLVDVTVAKGTESDVLTSAYTYTCPPPSGTGLFFMLVMAGGLGGCVHALRSLYWYSGQGELKWRWMPMYFALPFMGAAMAMIFSLLIIAGFVDQTTGRSQALFIIAVAGLVGMFSQQAALKLTDVANAFFTKPGGGENAKPQESLSVGQTQTAPSPLTATHVVPATGKTGDTVTITGSGFNTSTNVKFDSVPGTELKILSPTSLTIKAPSHAAGPVDVEVSSGDQSVKLPGAFTYTT